MFYIHSVLKLYSDNLKSNINLLTYYIRSVGKVKDHEEKSWVSESI